MALHSSYNGVELLLCPSWDRASQGSGYVYDFSPNGRVNQLVNGGGWIGENYVQALNFDGVNDRLNIGGTIAVGTTFSISFWIRPDGAAASVQTIFGHTSGTVRVDFRGSSAGADAGKIRLVGPGGTFHSSGTIAANQWSHVAIRCNAGSGTIFLNGAASGTFSGWTATSAAAFHVGAYGSGSTDPFDGQIDDLFFWSREITFAEVTFLSSERAALFIDQKKPTIVDVAVGAWPSHAVGDLLFIVRWSNSGSLPSLLSGFTDESDVYPNDSISVYVRGMYKRVATVETSWIGSANDICFSIRDCQDPNETSQGIGNWKQTTFGVNESFPIPTISSDRGSQALFIWGRFQNVSNTFGTATGLTGLKQVVSPVATGDRWQLWEHRYPFFPLSNPDLDLRTGADGTSATGLFVLSFQSPPERVRTLGMFVEAAGQTAVYQPVALLASFATAEVLGGNGAPGITITVQAATAEVLGGDGSPGITITASAMVAEALGDTVAGGPVNLKAFAQIAEVVGFPPLPERIHARAMTAETLGSLGAFDPPELFASQMTAETLGSLGAFDPSELLAAWMVAEAVGVPEVYVPTTLTARAMVGEILGRQSLILLPYLAAGMMRIEVLGKPREPIPRRDHEELFLSVWDSTRWFPIE